MTMLQTSSHTDSSPATTDAAPGTAVRRAGRRLRITWPRTLVHIVVFAFMIVWFTPVLGLLVSSVRTQTDAAQTGWWNAFIEPLLTGYNYQQAISIIGVGPSLGTSLAITLPVTVLTVLLSAIGAFALTRMAFVGRTVLSLVLVATLLVPPQVTLVPMLKFFNAVGVSSTVPAIWIYMVGFSVPFGVFLVRGFISSIPEEIFEAANLDGASPHRIFRSIVLPLAGPVLAALAVMQFLWAWNDLLTPLIFLGGSEVPEPITVNVAGLASNKSGGQSQLMAATFLSIVLPLIVLISMQRYFVRGVLGGATKG